jgi:hypothetical protein
MAFQQKQYGINRLIAFLYFDYPSGSPLTAKRVPKQVDRIYGLGGNSSFGGLYGSVGGGGCLIRSRNHNSE